MPGMLTVFPLMLVMLAVAVPVEVLRHPVIEPRFFHDVNFGAIYTMQIKSPLTQLEKPEESVK